MFGDKITVYHLVGDTYTRYVLEGVYFKHNKSVNVNSNGVANGGGGVIRIPTTTELNLDNGDYIIEGNITDDWNLNYLLKHYSVFKVISITNNIRGGLKHFKVEVSL